MTSFNLLDAEILDAIRRRDSQLYRNNARVKAVADQITRPGANPVTIVNNRILSLQARGKIEHDPDRWYLASGWRVRV